MIKLIGLYLVLGLLSACATNSTSLRVPFPEAEYSALGTGGTGTISGQLYIEAKYGDKLAKQGAKIVLNPVTSYSAQWYETTAVMKQYLEPPDPRVAKYIREAVTDSEGRFQIDNIPAGEYYLSSALVWEAPKSAGVSAPMTPQGRFVVKRVTVRDKENLAVSLKSSLRLDSDSIDASKPSIGNMQLWTAWSY